MSGKVMTAAVAALSAATVAVTVGAGWEVVQSPTSTFGFDGPAAAEPSRPRPSPRERGEGSIPTPTSIADEIVRPEPFDSGLASVRPERSEAESKGEAFAQDSQRISAEWVTPYAEGPPPPGPPPPRAPEPSGAPPRAKAQHRKQASVPAEVAGTAAL